MSKQRRNHPLLYSLALGVSSALFLGCPSSEPGISEQGGGPLVLRLEVEPGPSLPEGAQFVVAAVSKVEAHLAGGWVELPVDERAALPAGERTLLARLVLSEAQSTIQSFRIHGEFELVSPDSRIRIPPARGVQINLRNQQLKSGAVNHVIVSLEGEFSKVGKHDWTLNGTLPATLEVDHESLVSAEATPGSGARLSLPDRFEIVIPPAALDVPVTVYVERVEDEGGPFYLSGPEGLTFDVPVTAKYPTGEGLLEPRIAWDGEMITGYFDETHRVVVENDHFSCYDDIEVFRTKLSDASILFEGRACGSNFSVVTVDLHHDQTMVAPLTANEIGTGGADSEQCVGKRVFEIKRVGKLMSPSTNSFDGYQPVAAINGDNWPYHDKDETMGCFRDLTVSGGDPLHEKVIGGQRFALEFENYEYGGALFETTFDADPLGFENALTANYQYVKDGELDFDFPYENAPKWLRKQRSRASVGLSEDGRYLFLAVADYGLKGHQWAYLMMNDWNVAWGGPSQEIIVHDLYRMDEGRTPELTYFDAMGFNRVANGSVLAPKGTNVALGIYWRQASPESPCVNDEVPQFQDVLPSNWFFEYVTTMLCYDAIDNNTWYRPGDDTNRAEFLKVLLEAAYPGVEFDEIDVNGFDHFDDVGSLDWFAPYVKFGYHQGIVEGYPQGDSWVFKPGEPVNRAEAAKMTVNVGRSDTLTATDRFRDLFSYFDSLNPNDIDPVFPDVQTNNWYYVPVYALHQFDGDGDGEPDGIVCGHGETGEYAPDGHLNRAEMAKIMCLAAGHCEETPCE